MATTNETTNRTASTLSPLARRVSFAGVAAVALVAVGAGAGAANAASTAPTAGKTTTTATVPVAGVPLKLAIPADLAAAHTAPAIRITPATAAKAAKPATPAKPAAPAKAVTPRRPAPARPAAPSAHQLMPHGTPGGQQRFSVGKKQLNNVATIVKAGQQMGLPPRAWVMAVACSMQESKLSNLGNLGGRNDHDSLGLFQQRPSSGWGSPSQILNPHYAATKFYQALKHVSRYQNLPLTTAVQRVQVSAFPQAYAKWEKFAADLVAGTFKR